MTNLESIIRPNVAVDVTPPSNYFGAQVPALTPTVVLAIGATVSWEYSITGDPSSIWNVGSVLGNDGGKLMSASSSGSSSRYMAAKHKEKASPNLTSQLAEAKSKASSYPPGS